MKTLTRTVLALVIASAATAGAQEVTEETERTSVFQGATYSNRTLAEIWGLEEEEIERFNRLKVIEDVYGDPKRPPFEVLGKHARNEEERSRYADMAIRQSLEQHVMSMEWGTAIMDRTPKSAALALQIIDSSPVLRSYMEREGGVTRDRYAAGARRAVLGTSETKSPGGLPDFLRVEEPAERALFFVDVQDCDEVCDALWSSAEASLESGDLSGVDVVLMRDANGRQQSRNIVVDWALEKGISSSDTTSKRVTLNHQDAEWTALLGENIPPYAEGRLSGSEIR